MAKDKRVLRRLSNISANECSVVATGANKVVGFEVVKQGEVAEQIFPIEKQDIIEIYDSYLSNELWNAFRYAMSNAVAEICWQNLPKEEKVTQIAILFEVFLNDIYGNPYMKSVQEEINVFKNKIKKSETNPKNVSDTQESRMKKEEKVSKLQELFDNILSVFKSGEEAEVVEETVEATIEEPVEEEIAEETVEEVIEETEETVVEEVVEEAVEETAEEITKSAEQVELEKAQDKVKELEAKIEEVQKAKEQAELEKAQQIEKSEKDSLILKAKEEISFIDGTVEENVEKLYQLKKSVSEEQFNWVYDSLRKKSESIEKGMDEVGFDTPEAEDLTVEKKLEKIAKEIESKEKITYPKAYRKALEINPDLANQVYYSNNTIEQENE